MATIKRVNPQEISKPFASYSHVVTAEGAKKLVFCAGQVAAWKAACCPRQLRCPGQARHEESRAGSRGRRRQALGRGEGDNLYLQSYDVPKARTILQEYFGGHPPGSTLRILRGLAHPNFLLEIEAIAAV